MSVHYLPEPTGQDRPSSDEAARELVFLAGPADAFLLPDGEPFDPVAVELAVNGIRHVRLTLAERLAAATVILASGGSVRSVCLRLSLPAETEPRWNQLHKRAAVVVSAVVILLVVVTSVTIATRPRGTDPHARHAQARVSRVHVYPDKNSRKKI